MNAVARKTSTKTVAPKKNEAKNAIAETTKLAFNVRGASHRATILLRLANDLGKPVGAKDLWTAVGDRAQFAAALRVLTSQGAKNKAPFTITKVGEGESATFTLKRRP